MKKLWKNILYALEELTYFVPDLFLALTVISLFIDLGKFHMLITICLAITYIGTSYGEYYFSRFMLVKRKIDGFIIKRFTDVENKINRKGFITIDYMLAYSDMIEEVIKEEINSLREELKGDVIEVEMGTEGSNREI